MKFNIFLKHPMEFQTASQALLSFGKVLSTLYPFWKTWTISKFCKELCHCPSGIWTHQFTRDFMDAIENAWFEGVLKLLVYMSGNLLCQCWVLDLKCLYRNRLGSQNRPNHCLKVHALAGDYFINFEINFNETDWRWAPERLQDH